MNDDFEKARAAAHVWYWIQLAIWPFIRNTGGCVYCIFLRGMIAGVVLTVGGWGIWKLLT